MKGTRSSSVKRLPAQLIDQIAAGEVVERPASVVKELLENSIDAGASRISVEIRGGGRDLIALTDNGSGMSSKDARLAIERHATSKIGRIEDFLTLDTYGFRGEALPAIASVSRFRLRTRLHGGGEGYQVSVNHGQGLEERADGCAEGTRVEVADLFEGLPARRKFLKKASTEWGHVADFLSRAALGLPEVHFDVIRDGKTVLQWPTSERLTDRIAAVLSERDAESLLSAELVRGDNSLRGFISRPDVHRGNSTGIYAFVNGRPVRDKVIRQAVTDAYRDYLPRGRYPIAVLFLTTPPNGLDVNVHPAKWEIRFSEPQAIYRLVRDSVKVVISERNFFGGEFRYEGERVVDRSGSMQNLRMTRPYSTSVAEAIAPLNQEKFSLNEAKNSEHSLNVSDRQFQFKDLDCIGQLLDTYLILEDPNGLLLVDQHAAHERVLYERLRASWAKGRSEKQILLLPVNVELDATTLSRLRDHSDVLDRMGFELEEFSEKSILVRAIPGILGDRDPARLIRILGESFGEDEIRKDEFTLLRELEPMDKLFATVACHSARRAGERLKTEEQAALLSDLDEIPWAPTCPHGRPVAVPIEKNEIERRFARR